MAPRQGQPSEQQQQATTRTITRWKWRRRYFRRSVGARNPHRRKHRRTRSHGRRGGGGVPNPPQNTVLRKHIVWALTAIVLGTVMVVALPLILTSNNSDGEGEPTPPLRLTPPCTSTHCSHQQISPSTEAPTPVPTESPTDIVVLSENSKLTASDGAADDQFGRSVAIAGDTIVVGAHQRR